MLCKVETCAELLQIINQQEQTVCSQNRLIRRLVNENAEQENMISVMSEETMV